MEPSEYKVLITASGVGSRIKELTQATNKALVPIGGKATISYIVEKYTPTTPLVVTLGYFGDMVRAFLEQTYPDRKFKFVTADPYTGEGSSQGYSMLQARDALQMPFIFHACDTIITEPIPTPEYNWAAGYVHRPGDGLEIAQYRTHQIRNGRILRLNDKGAEGFNSIHIGLVGIKNYQLFWKTLHELYNADRMDQSLGDVPVLDEMIRKGESFAQVPYTTWLDTGNISAFRRAEAHLARTHRSSLNSS